MKYEFGVTVHGYIVVEAPSRNDAAKVFNYSFDQILQETQFSSIELQYHKRQSGKGGEKECQARLSP